MSTTLSRTPYPDSRTVTSPPRRGARALAEENGNAVVFDAVFAIDEQQIHIAADLANIKEKGIEFGLPPNTSLELGSIADFGDWAAETLEVPKVEWNDLPSVLKDVVTAKIFLERFQLALKADQQKVDTKVRVDFYKDLVGKLKFESLIFEVKLERTSPTPP